MTGRRRQQREPLRVEAFITVDGQATNVDALTENQRERLGTWLKATYLNELFSGQAQFTAQRERI